MRSLIMQIYMNISFLSWRCLSDHVVSQMCHAFLIWSYSFVGWKIKEEKKKNKRISNKGIYYATLSDFEEFTQWKVHDVVPDSEALNKTDIVVQTGVILELQ